MHYEHEAPIKDPVAILDHAMPWDDWLDDGETITARSVTSSAPDELQAQAGALDSAQVTWRVSGGQAGRDYAVTVQITTSTGRCDERSVLYRVRER